MILTKGLIQVANSKVFCKLGNSTVRDLTQDTVYVHPAEKQCNYSVDTSSFATKSELQEMKDELNEKIPVTDGEGNVVYESEPFFVDNNTYSGQAYPGTPATLKQYSIDFGGRAVSSIKCIAEVKTISIDYTGGVQLSASVSLSTASGIEIGSASNAVGKSSIINANANFQQFLTEVVIVVKGSCPAAAFGASSSYTSINYLQVYLPEQLLS